MNQVEASPLGLAVRFYNQAKHEVRASVPSWLKSNEMARDAAWETVGLLVELGADLDRKFVVNWDDESVEVSAADCLKDDEVRKLRAVQEQRFLEQNTMKISAPAYTGAPADGSYRPAEVDEDLSPMRVPSPDPKPRAPLTPGQVAEAVDEYDRYASTARRL